MQPRRVSTARSTERDDEDGELRHPPHSSGMSRPNASRVMASGSGPPRTPVSRARRAGGARQWIYSNSLLLDRLAVRGSAGSGLPALSVALQTAELGLRGIGPDIEPGRPGWQAVDANEADGRRGGLDPSDAPWQVEVESDGDPQ